MSTFFPLVFELPRWCSVKESACQAGNKGSSLGREDPLEEKMAIHSSFLSGKSHGQRSLAGYSPWGCKESDRNYRLNTSEVKNHTAHSFLECLR